MIKDYEKIIISILKNNKKGISFGKLQEQSKITEPTLAKYLRKLIEENKVEKSKKVYTFAPKDIIPIPLTYKFQKQSVKVIVGHKLLKKVNKNELSKEEPMKQSKPDKLDSMHVYVEYQLTNNSSEPQPNLLCYILTYEDSTWSEIKPNKVYQIMNGKRKDLPEKQYPMIFSPHPRKFDFSVVFDSPLFSTDDITIGFDFQMPNPRSSYLIDPTRFRPDLIDFSIEYNKVDDYNPNAYTIDMFTGYTKILKAEPTIQPENNTITKNWTFNFKEIQNYKILFKW